MDITNSRAAFEHLIQQMNPDQEEFWVLALTSSKRLIESRMLFRGTVDYCPIHPREIFRFAIRVNASAILVAHNHPHGDPTPSEQDIRYTSKLVRAGQIMEIPIVDHLVMAKDFYRSLAEDGLISSPS